MPNTIIRHFLSIVLCERLRGRLSYLCPSFSLPDQKSVGQRTPTCLFLSLWTTSSSMKTSCVADRRFSEFWQRIGSLLCTNKGDVLLPLSTLKRTDAQSVQLNWTQSKVKQTDKRMSTEGGQATNNLPTFFHYLFVLVDLRLT